MKKTFKTFLAVAIAALTLSLTGCTKDKEDLILGTWKVVSNTVTYNMGGQTETESLLDGEATITFKNDGTVTTWSKDEDGEEYTESGKWSISDDKLKLEYEDSETQMMPVMTFNIDKLDKKNLELSYKGNMMGVNVDMKMSLKKI